MRILGATVVILVACLTVAGFQDRHTKSSDSLERAFAGGGRITMDLSAGEYRIEGSRDDRIRINWSTRSARGLRESDVRAELKGSEAWISTDGPKNFRAMIEVPARSNLLVRLTAGELALRGVEGDKDVELHAGELDLDVGKAEDYGRVDAGVWAGELQAPAYQISKEGLFRSFEWRGQGKYRLHAHLKAGELRLTSSAR
jgi:hypothetical protein